MDKPLRVGIIGLGAERGWATAAHIPALHARSGDFELALFTRLFPQSKSPQTPANACELFDRLVDFMRAFSGLIQASQD